METLVIYDISDDQIRLKVSEACKRFGLARIQRSSFMGYMNSASRKELVALLKRILGDEDGNIQILVICKADLALRQVVGKPYEEYAKAEFIF